MFRDLRSRYTGNAAQSLQVSPPVRRRPPNIAAKGSVPALHAYLFLLLVFLRVRGDISVGKIPCSR
jgi:hypothetical protein